MLAARLFFVLVIKAQNYADRQEAYMTQYHITAARGTYLCRNMNVLVQDATCSKVSGFPNSVEDAE